uniref:Neural cell adhesion molecule L1-like protein n=1 Tax=Esox lucius TaxID=8010 RepID=A0A6Q2WQ88_ESOLU
MNTEISVFCRAMRMRSSKWSPGLALLMGVVTSICAFTLTAAIDIPLEVLGHVNIEQLPTITEASPGSMIAFPFDESFPMTCKAKGNPEPEFRWTKDGEDFDPYQDPRLIKEDNSGTFVIPNTGNLTEYQGTYRCYATNKLGTAITEEIEFIVPHVPKFPKEKIDPIEVEEGQPVILECNPPKGIPPLQIYWMTIDLRHIEQDDRVSMGLNGDLFFSNALWKDSRRDYCCFAAFPRIRTIVQKTAMSLIVKSSRCPTKRHDYFTVSATARYGHSRKPSLLVPSGVKSETRLVKGETLQLECIAEGFPTPKIEWVKIDHRLPDKVSIENHGKLLTIHHVDEEDSGKYRCKAKNIHGEAVHNFDVSVEEPPRWVTEPESQLSMIGSDVHIKCSASGTPPPTIQWMVNGKPLEGTFTHPKQTRTAVYQCEASNRHGTLLANANIMIMNQPPMILTENGLEYSAVQGKGVVMHCKVFSSPPSTVTWLVNGPGSVEGPRFTVHENGSLEIHNAEKEDVGQYTCDTENTEGKSAITAVLEVKDPTKIYQTPKDLQVPVGSTAHFSCLSVYDNSFSDDFQIVWEKDDTVIALNRTENSGYLIEDGMLQIVNVSHRDQGMYKCVARTPVDLDTASAVLIVLDVPDAPEDLVLSERKGRSVKLKWIPGKDHNSSITDFIIEYEESQWEPGNWNELQRVPGNHDSAVLKLYGHVDYRFRVSGVNAIGRGRPSEPTERYKTPPSAPDKNPENIKIEGHLPHELDINWEPLSPIEHNGPGLEYKVSYKRQDVEEDWQEHVVKRHSFVVKNTPTFVPYEIQIQARNYQGWAPEPKVVTGYSGEDFPSAAPDDVAVEVMNNSLVKVSWTPVHKDKLHGHLGGYRINWWKLRSLLDSKKTHGEKHTLTVPGERNHAVVPGLTPFTEYSLMVMTFNGRGSGPGSHPVTFKTPEGGKIGREGGACPFQKNGLICTVALNNTEEVGVLQLVNISNPGTTAWTLRDLEPVSRYKFYLRSCTRAGCGPQVSDETTTTPEASNIHGGISTQGWFIGLMCAVALLTLIVLIACFVNRNKGGKYSGRGIIIPLNPFRLVITKEKLYIHDNDEKPLKGSQHSLSGQIKAEDSGDSLVDYGDEDVQFNEDGSFIGEYAGRKEKRVSMEVKGTTKQSTA